MVYNRIQELYEMSCLKEILWSSNTTYFALYVSAAKFNSLGKNNNYWIDNSENLCGITKIFGGKHQVRGLNYDPYNLICIGKFLNNLTENEKDEFVKNIPKLTERGIIKL